MHMAFPLTPGLKQRASLYEPLRSNISDACGDREEVLTNKHSSTKDQTMKFKLMSYK